VDLTVVIPTRNRRPILFETLRRLESQVDETRFEVVVVDDGSSDGTAEAVRERAAELPFPLTLIEQHGAGPAVARNRAIDAARAPVCLFIDDDSWPTESLIRRHADFHAERPRQELALLGRIDLPSEPPPTPFTRWMAELHIDRDIEDAEDAGGHHFYTGNVSAKTAFLKSVGGFDERLADHEDIDMGLRLEERGMRLAYDAQAVVEHYSPIDLPMAIRRMGSVGRTLAYLAERHPGYPVPRRPDARHRAKAAALTCLAALGLRTPRVRHEMWRFLCHEASREAYWAAVDGKQRELAAKCPAPRIGRRLAVLASRDAAAQLPPGGRPRA
jgi:glycosyltransferase involved in cell wall biosynthesis